MVHRLVCGFHIMVFKFYVMVCGFHIMFRAVWKYHITI